MSGVALVDIDVRFTWQAWHNLTSTFVLRGRRGTYGTGWRAGAGFSRPGRRGTLAWQAWHNLTSTFVSRGRRGTYGTGWRAWAGFSRPGRRGTFAWQAWHLLTSTCVSPVRRGTISHPASFCVAGVALMALGGAFGLFLVARDAAALLRGRCGTISHPFVLRGRRGTISHPPSFRVASVALVALGGALGLVLVARDAAALCVAGVALVDIDVRFTCQAWHNLTSTFVLRGRCGTYGTGWRAGAGFSRPGRRGTFAWQVWHNLTSTFVLRGRRGTISHYPSFRVAGVALMALGGALGLVFVARDAAALLRLISTFVLRGRRGTILHYPSFRVAGVALMALGGALGLVLVARDAAALLCGWCGTW